jgi:hypothetical protein
MDGNRDAANTARALAAQMLAGALAKVKRASKQER